MEGVYHFESAGIAAGIKGAFVLISFSRIHGSIVRAVSVSRGKNCAWTCRNVVIARSLFAFGSATRLWVGRVPIAILCTRGRGNLSSKVGAMHRTSFSSFRLLSLPYLLLSVFPTFTFSSLRSLYLCPFLPLLSPPFPLSSLPSSLLLSLQTPLLNSQTQTPHTQSPPCEPTFQSALPYPHSASRTDSEKRSTLATSHFPSSQTRFLQTVARPQTRAIRGSGCPDCTG